MNVPELLWHVTVAAALAAVLVLAGLVARRAFVERQAAARKAERTRYTALLLGEGGDVPAPPASRHSRIVLTDLTVDVLRLVRGEARTALVAQASRLGVTELLCRRLRRGNVRVRLVAAEALGHFNDPEAVAALDEALDDPSPDVRLTAALSLAAAGHSPPARELVRRLGIGEEERSLLVVSLFREIAGKDPKDVRALILDPSTLPAVKASAAEALAACDDFPAVPAIVALAIAADPGSDELPRYLGALAEIEHPAGAPAVLHGLDSPSPEARAAAAAAAGRIGMKEAVARLGALLGDPAWWVRFHSGRALLRLGPEGIERLEKVAALGDERAREAAALTLAEHGAAA